MINFGKLIGACCTKIELIALQTKKATLYLAVTLCMFCSMISHSQDLPNNDAKPIPSVQDTISATQNDSIPIDAFRAKEQLAIPDSVGKIDSVKVNRNETLTDRVKYKATDYERISRKFKKIFLYNEAEVIYEDMKINAGEIIVDYANNTVFAKGIVDTTGKYTQTPIFVQANNEVVPDSIVFNFDTEQAIVFGSRIEDAGQGLGVISERSKRVSDSIVFLRNVKFTTSENLDDPDYYFYARQVKLVPGKKIITGLVNMYIADVPTPLGVPFAFFPLSKERSVSGVILPQPGETRQRGFHLQNGGYYFALSDYYNLAVTGDFYTNGSYALRFDSDYRWRYKFNGRISLNFERILMSERGLPDFSETNTYNFRWNHSQDQKSSPNSRFSASVNLGSSNFFQQSLNQSNTGNFLNNNFSSSVSYSKNFNGKIPVNLTVAATHSQNSRTEQINLTLPQAQVNVDRIYPFAPKEGSKKGILQNINFSYSSNGQIRFQTTDSLFFRPEMFEAAEIGVQHNIPIATNFKVLNYLSATISANYTENWVFETIDQRYDPETRSIVRDTVPGFDRFGTYNAGVSLGTTIYGTFDFGEDKRIQSIRHVIRPTISYGYTPEFDQFFQTIRTPDLSDPSATELTEEVEFSRFDGGFFGSPSNNLASSVSLTLNNQIEAKVRPKDSTATEPRKIALLRNLNLAASYNFAADSLKLSPINMSGAIPIIQDKLDINFRAVMDIYALDNTNRRINTLNINNGGSLFRLTSASANFGYNFSSSDFNGSDDDTDRTQNQTFASGGRPDDLFGGGVDITGAATNAFTDEEEDEQTADEIEFYNFKIPWNLRLSYQVNYSNSARQNQISSHSLVFSGDLELGKRWRVRGSSGYDLVNPGFTFTSLGFARDLESWSMNFTWVPFSNRASWNFFIGIKSGVFEAVKYDKRRRPDERL